MGKMESLIKKSANRRTFLKTGITAAGAATMGASYWARGYRPSVKTMITMAISQKATSPSSGSSMLWSRSRPICGFNILNWEEPRTTKSPE